MQKFKSTSLSALLGLSLVLLSTETFSARFQAFNGISYRNPAELSLLVKDTQIIAGDTWVSPEGNYTGSVTVPPPSTPAGQPSVTSTGRSAITSNFDLPFGRIAKRLSPNWVVSLDFTEPFVMRIQYPINSPVRYAGTLFDLGVQDIAPTVAYHFDGPLSKLLVGAALDTYLVNLQLNQQYPSLPALVTTPPPPHIRNFGASTDNAFTNSGSGREYGWHAGAMYHIFTPTFIGISYFSKISPFLKGKSTFTGYPTNNNLTTTITLPATTNLGLTQVFNSRLIAEFNIYYTQWSQVGNLIVANTAGPSSTATSAFNYRDTWRYSATSHLKLTPKFTLTNVVAYEKIPASSADRSPLVPAANNWTVGVSLEYNVIKEAIVALNYSHIFFPSTSPINQTSAAGVRSVGEASVAANVIGARLTINV